MKLEPAIPENGMKPIDAYGDGGFRIDGTRHKGPIILGPFGVLAWDVSGLSDVSMDSLQGLIDARPQPEFILLGTGDTFRAPPPGLVRSLRDTHNIGLEFMDTGAACRLYNVLGSEGRNFCAALLPAG